MGNIYLRELKSGFKSFLIWTLSVGIMGLICILLYKSMEESIADMAEAFAGMGSFADAFGMSTISIATLTGFFASEGGTVHGLGGGMFAAVIASGIISKEEAGHSAEFLMALPVSRSKVVTSKILAVISELVAFNAVCGALYAVGFAVLGEELPTGKFMLYMAASLLMNTVIAMICILISTVPGGNKAGIGMGAALFLYFFDLMARVVPKLEKAAFITPYSFANAPDIFSGESISYISIVTGICIIAICLAGCYTIYNRRDLKS